MIRRCVKPLSLLSLSWLVLAALTQAGCTSRLGTIADAFPKGSYASPWVLRDAVWTGTLEQAAGAIGAEAAAWEPFAPERVWLAVYEHDTNSADKLIVRAWAFASTTQAHRAFEHFRPEDARSLEAGDEGCWTADGILVIWGRMVFDIFGTSPTSDASPEQALYLLAFLEKQMHPDLPSAPR
jgi:hypothetical protein